jgi:hypothetical protein
MITAPSFMKGIKGHQTLQGKGIPLSGNSGLPALEKMVVAMSDELSHQNYYHASFTQVFLQ